MIILTIALTIAGGVIAALAIISTVVILRNSRLEREKKAALRDEERMQAALKAQISENSTLQEELRHVHAENAALNARNTALVEAMEARPTQPKRTVRKSSAQQEEHI